MSDVSAVLGLPYILPSQAQKHVTHNEALRLLDVLVQLSVLDRTLTVPPAAPEIGQRWIVGFGGTGAWAGRDGQVAALLEDGWLFVVPRAGWRAMVQAEGRGYQFDGAQWLAEGSGPQLFPQVGIATSSDEVNRLAVASEATLFSHAGAGHQVKVNKAAPGDTASLLFQSGWSGRAEMGLAGTDDFAVKVSADGATFVTALSADGASGTVVLPGGARLADGTAAAPSLAFDADPDTGVFSPAPDRIGLVAGGVERLGVAATGVTVNAPVTGTAVTQGQTDGTAGRLLKVGDFGLGGACQSSEFNAERRSGFYFGFSGTPGAPHAGAANWALLNLGMQNLNNLVQIAVHQSLSVPRMHLRRITGGVGDAWYEVYHSGRAVGSVAQSGGVPTGALFERGANANGDYVRFADGTQICWQVQSIELAIDVAFMGGFRTPMQTWSYPAAFAVSPNLQVTARAQTAFGAISAGSPLTLTATWAATAVAVQASGPRTVMLQAVGRWF